MINGKHEVSCAVNTGMAMQVAWNRSCAFSLVGQRFPAVARLIAPWMWPFHFVAVGGQGDRIRLLNGMSLAVDDGAPHRAHRPTLVLATLCLMAEFCLILFGGFVLATALLPVLGPNSAALVGVLIVASPLVLEGLVGGIIRMICATESLTLNSRRRELSEESPAAVMSSLVRCRHSPSGTARLLLGMMKSEWQVEHSVVIFYPAAEPLIRYYSSEGAVLDEGAKRRMKFDFR